MEQPLLAGNMSESHQHDWVTQGQMLLDQRFMLKAAVSNVHGGKKDAGNLCAAPPVAHGHLRPPNRLRARAGGGDYRGGGGQEAPNLGKPWVGRQLPAPGTWGIRATAQKT